MASKALLPRVDFLGLGLGVMLAGVLGFVMLNASEKRHEWQPSEKPLLRAIYCLVTGRMVAFPYGMLLLAK